MRREGFGVLVVVVYVCMLVLRPVTGDNRHAEGVSPALESQSQSVPTPPPPSESNTTPEHAASGEGKHTRGARAGWGAGGVEGGGLGGGGAVVTEGEDEVLRKQLEKMEAEVEKLTEINSQLRKLVWRGGGEEGCEVQRTALELQVDADDAGVSGSGSVCVYVRCLCVCVCVCVCVSCMRLLCACVCVCVCVCTYIYMIYIYIMYI
jgi:hypothetical protein